jgi:hypothetical protein
VAATARMLGCSRVAIDRIVKTFAQGGNVAVGQLKWGAGRPMKYHGLTQQEMDTAVSKETLVAQTGMTMNQRAA